MLTSLRGELFNVNLNVNYTLSKSMSDRIDVGVSNPNQTFQVGKDRAQCASDRRHIFNLTGVASTPRFDRPAWSAVASDWRLALIYRWSSGEPLTVVAGADRALTGLAGQPAQQVSDHVYLDTSGRLGSQYFNRDAFVQPELGTYSTTGFLAFRSFANWSLDAALSRAFTIGAQRLEARVEAFNLTNTVHPNNPVANVSSGNFGRVTGVQDPRIMQFALKYVF